MACSEGGQECYTYKEPIKTFHDIAGANSSVTPGVPTVFGSDINKVLLLHDSLMSASERIRGEIPSSFFVSVHHHI